VANEIRVTKAAAYVESDPDGKLRLTKAAAYVESDPDGKLRLTKAAAYVERTQDNKLRITQAAAFVEYLVSFAAPPTAPSSLTATAASDTLIDLDWTDNASDETGFKIERSPDGAAWSQIATVGANVTGYSNTGLTPATLYYYRVRAYNDEGDSAYGNTASATTHAPPVIVREVKAEIEVDWDIDGVYTDETPRLVQARGSIRLAPPGQNITSGSGIVATATVELENNDNRYSPLVSTGDLYAYIAGGGMYRAPIRVSISLDDGATYHTVFTGVMKIPSNETLAPRQPKTISIDARGNEERLLNRRVSTSHADFVAAVDAGQTESQHIADILSGMGLSGGEYSLDDGLYTIPYFWLDQSSPVEACWQLAAAAGGRFYARHDGIFVYENATHWLSSPHTTSQQTYDRGSYANLRIWYDDTNLASQVEGRWRLLEQTISDADSPLWTAREAFSVPPGATKALLAELSSPLYTITGVSYSAATPGGTDISGSVTLTRTDYAQRINLEFANGHSTAAAIISNLIVYGTSISESDTATVTRTTEQAFWDATTRGADSFVRRISNPWVQSEAQAAALAEFVLGRQELPPLMYLLSGVPGNPERRIGDRITIDDNELMDSARSAYIVGIDWSYGRNGFRQNITAIDAAGLYPYIGASPGYFIIGTNKLGAADALRGRLFY